MSAAGDSSEQRSVEHELMRRFGDQEGLVLAKRRYELPDGGWLEVDGVSESPLVLVEAWAHQGPPKSAQKNKVVTDAFKLLYVEQLVQRRARKVLLLSEGGAADFFRGKSWVAQALRQHEIEVATVGLPLHLRELVKDAQKRQYR